MKAVPENVLTSREEILAACEAGGVVVFLGDDPPFSADEEDGFVACRATGPDGTFFVIGGEDKRDVVEHIARQIVEDLLGAEVTGGGPVH